MCFLRKNSYLVVLTSDRLEIWTDGRYYKYLSPKKFSKVLAPKLTSYSQLKIGVFRKKSISDVLTSDFHEIWRGGRYYQNLPPKIFYNFWRQIWSYRPKKLANSTYFCNNFIISRHSYIRFSWNLERWLILLKSTTKIFLEFLAPNLNVQSKNKSNFLVSLL